MIRISLVYISSLVIGTKYIKPIQHSYCSFVLPENEERTRFRNVVQLFSQTMSKDSRISYILLVFEGATVIKYSGDMIREIKHCLIKWYLLVHSIKKISLL
jgi:hypothetical protein